MTDANVLIRNAVQDAHAIAVTLKGLTTLGHYSYAEAVSQVPFIRQDVQDLVSVVNRLDSVVSGTVLDTGEPLHKLIEWSRSLATAIEEDSDEALSLRFKDSHAGSLDKLTTHINDTYDKAEEYFHFLEHKI